MSLSMVPATQLDNNGADTFYLHIQDKVPMKAKKGSTVQDGIIVSFERQAVGPF